MSGAQTRYDPLRAWWRWERVELELVDGHGEAESLAVDIVPDEAADLAEGFLGASTPWRAVMGRPAGSRVPYRMGDLVEVRILAVSRSTRVPDASAAAARRPPRAAVDRAAIEETIQLAATFSSKRGDYDPRPWSARTARRTKRMRHECDRSPARGYSGAAGQSGGVFVLRGITPCGLCACFLRATASSGSGGSGEPAAPPATFPVTHAQRKLNPPIGPNASSISPHRYRPRETAFQRGRVHLVQRDAAPRHLRGPVPSWPVHGRS